jgi:hypothetical protein
MSSPRLSAHAPDRAAFFSSAYGLAVAGELPPVPRTVTANRFTVK